MSENKNNFRCPESGDEFYIYEHSTSYGSSGAIYKDKWRKQLVHPETGVILEPIPKKIDWSDGIAPATINGNDKAGRAKTTEQLKKRSKDHYKKEISDKRYNMNKDLVDKFKAE